ncbi:MAG: WecB/TagA/CpsF family glycosyltransferase [Candidatus Berkelbacteria bacterium]
MSNRVKILNISIDAVTSEEVLAKLAGFVEDDNKHIISTVNTEFIINAQKDEKFREVLNEKSSLNLADSFGVIWASWFENLPKPKSILGKITICFTWLFSLISIPLWPNLYKKVVPEKISGSDFIWTLSKFAAKNHLKAFLFGGGTTIAERTALKLQADIDGFRVVGVAEGHPLPDTAEIIAAIKKTNADILYLAIGSPTQEKWLAENLEKTGCKIGIGLGGTFDFISGTKKRAPLWMQKSGLEWFYRLTQEPSRIKRQLALPNLAWQILIKKLY